MEEKEKKKKRIRHPKRNEVKQEEKKHFVLDVQDGTVSSLNNFGK